MSVLTALPSPTLRAVCLALVVGLGAAGCDHVTDPDGPNLVDRFGPFSVLQTIDVTQPTVDFAAGEEVAFTATFNKQVEWVVVLTGRESNAVKRIEGFSNALTAANASWNGSTTELPFFKDEVVDVALVIPDEATDTLRTTVEVLSPRTYPGNVAASFEGDDDITVGNFEFELEGSGVSTSPAVTTDVPAAQGDGFFLFQGTDDVVSNFFVGLIDIRPSGGLPAFAVPTSVPEDLVFNFFLYSFDLDHTIAVIQLIVDGNGTGQYEVDQDTVLPFGDIVVEGEGWQAFSKPVSALGMSQTQAQEIVALRVLLISDNNSQPTPPLQVAFGLDYFTFTAGGPLEL